ncbi:Uncharacterized protein K02A2.6 [Araneus ventricosus]|uniref:Uncharacterized protein K02A2.6 n=1 Tax=Araneus ventricosus TaxID=182803 RepID=A0A4Y2E4U0_ARAVE|nr:Uncharacterized protein K02A2.6 [Araneus ventricosus]
MMDALRPPASLKFSIGNVKEKWRKWRHELENYLLATVKDECANKIKIAILQNLLGSDGLELFNTFKFEPPESQKNYSEVLKKFEEYCSPLQNVVYERYKFCSCVQQEGQAIECYVMQLKTLASTCEFEEQQNGLIRDRIVLGIRDSGLKERLLRESGLGLEKAIEIVRAAETNREQLHSMKEETAAQINSVKRNRRQNQPKQSSQEYECKKCGRKHKPRECPAYGKMCAKCDKNHFAAKCFQNSKNIHKMKVPENELDIYIDSVTEKVQENELKSDSMNKNVQMGQDEKFQIILKDNAIPVIHPPRQVPRALQPKFKETLDKLEKEKEKIVSKVNKPTDWVQRLVIVEKPNGNLKLCLDPKVIKREHYQIPSADDIISRLEGKRIFSVVDLKDGFRHVPLDEVSCEICTFNTPFGRYKFNKMPFGIASAPEILQKRNQKPFGDIEGVKVYFDDIIVAGKGPIKYYGYLFSLRSHVNVVLQYAFEGNFSLQQSCSASLQPCRKFDRAKLQVHNKTAAPQVNANDVVTTRRTCSKLVASNSSKTEYADEPRIRAPDNSLPNLSPNPLSQRDLDCRR